MDLDYLHQDLEAQPDFHFETNFVYALITLPSRVAATRSSAYKTCEEHSSVSLSHNLQADVVPYLLIQRKAKQGQQKN